MLEMDIPKVSEILLQHCLPIINFTGVKGQIQHGSGLLTMKILFFMSKIVR